MVECGVARDSSRVSADCVYIFLESFWFPGNGHGPASKNGHDTELSAVSPVM